MAAPATFAPNFTVRMAGQPLPTAMRAAITSIRHQDGMQGADRVELTLANDRSQWLDHPLLQPDTPLELDLGYAPDALERVFVGEITGVEPSFPSSGMPTMRVVAHDFLQRLTVGTKDRAFALSLPCIGKFPLPDPLVAALVSGTNLLIPALDPVGAALSFLTLLVAYAIDPLEAKRSIRIQQGQSDFDFLSGLAKDNGWEMYIDHTRAPQGYVLRFQFLIQDYSASTTLRWGASLLDFTPRITTVGQVAAIATRIWISAIKTEFVVVLGWDFDRAAFDLQVYPGLGDLDALLGSQKARGVLRIDAIGPATAPKKILSELLPRLNNRQTGSGTTIGDPGIKAGRVIALEGLGNQFGGLYRVTSATHTIDGGGFRTAFEARKEVWFGSIPTPKGAGGLVRVQGQTIGTRGT
jgi:phage protein D